ncbi:MAG: hypothetical protein JWN69_807 [Alphaproteobacteria bacterium]|nr:hypothetical protein [Alphaproteobacteria bacterium]
MRALMVWMLFGAGIVCTAGQLCAADRLAGRLAGEAPGRPRARVVARRAEGGDRRAGPLMCARTDAALAVRAAAQGLRSVCLSKLPMGLIQDSCTLPYLPPAAPDVERMFTKLAGFEIDDSAA